MTTTQDVQFTGFIKGGLPVRVVATIAPAEPDVGLFESWVDDWEFYWLKGGPVPQKIIDQIGQHEWDTLEEEALKAT